MKIRRHLLLAIVSALLLCSFSMDVSYYGENRQTPVLMERSDFEAAIKTIAPMSLNKTSRINLLGDYIYIVESYKGIHVINNSDVTAPYNAHFINVPGCVDMAIKDDVMYVRSAEDLVAINISNLSSIIEINRVKETFPELGMTDEDYSLPYRFQKGQRPENTVIVDWETMSN